MILRGSRAVRDTSTVNWHLARKATVPFSSLDGLAGDCRRKAPRLFNATPVIQSRVLSSALRERLMTEMGSVRVSAEKTVVATGLCGHTEAAILMTGGRVSVNGKLATRLTEIGLISDSLEVTGSPIEDLINLTCMVDKPANLFSSSEEGISGRAKQTAKDLAGLPRPDTFVACVASLDYLSSGVVVFSNDRKFANISDSLSVWKVFLKSNFRPPEISVLRGYFDSAEFLDERILQVSGRELSCEKLWRMFPGAFRLRRQRLGEFAVVS